MNDNKITAWHFSNGNNLRYNDERKIVLGETLTAEGKIIPCINGFHGSEKALDALKYAPGPNLWKVELEGELQSHGKPVDKHVARNRTAIAGSGNAREMILKFGRECALDVAYLWPNMPAVIKEFLETGNPELVEKAKNVFGNSNINIIVANNATYSYTSFAIIAAYYAAYYSVYYAANISAKASNIYRAIKYSIVDCSMVDYSMVDYSMVEKIKNYDMKIAEYQQKFETLCEEFVNL